MAELRTPSLKDAAAIARVHVDAWRETYSEYVPESFFGHDAYESRRAMWTRYLSESEPFGTLTVADADGQIVGFSFSGPARGPDAEKGFAPARQLQLFSVYLLAAVQGTGIGGRLLNAAVGNHPAQLWVASRNVRAIEFYRSRGFETDGVEHPDPTIPGVLDLRMVR